MTTQKTHEWLLPIIEDVSRETGVSIEKILGLGRTDRVSFARQMVWFIAYSRGMTQPKIAEAFGRDPSTVSSGIARIRRLPGFGVEEARTVTVQFALLHHAINEGDLDRIREHWSNCRPNVSLLARFVIDSQNDNVVD